MATQFVAHGKLPQGTAGTFGIFARAYWEFTNRNDGAFEHGPGRCADPRVEDAFRIQQSQEVTAPFIGLAITTACVILGVLAAAVIVSLCQANMADMLTMMKWLGVALGVEAGCLLVIRALRRRRPPAPQF